MKGVSIIIPSYNEEDNIRPCLDSVTSLDFEGYEVIVADGRSTDKTRQIIKDEYPYVKLLDNKKKHTAGARNLAIKKAKYDLVAFTDADCVVPKDWLKILVGGYFKNRTSSLAGVGGANFAPDDSPEFVRSVSKAQQTFLGNLGSVQGKIFTESKVVPSIATCNALYSKKVLLEIGCFDEAHKDLGEDWEMNYRLGKAGYKLMVIKGSYVWHKFRATPSKFFSNMYRYGMGRAILMKKYPESIRMTHLLPLCFIGGMLLVPPLILPYLVAISIASTNVKDADWFDISLIYVLQHFGYALGEVFGLLFNDKIRL